MLREIAEGKLNVSRDTRGKFEISQIRQAIARHESQQPLQIPAQNPAWNAPVGDFVKDRGDGTFVDTGEFDKPVPQKSTVVAAEVPSVASNVQIPQYGSKEEKLAALQKLGLMKGSQLT